MAAEENIKVAVRLRPFLPILKEESEGKSMRIVHMDELSSTVSITNPENPADNHKFMFDSILWSFDGFTEMGDGYLAADNKSVSEEMYCDQKQVYDEIGKEMVQNLWNGYNSSLFTFGESKSGKSWTMFGTGVNKGIVPQALTDLFKGVREKEKSFQQNGSTLEVRLGMAEVYHERVKDLLPSTSSTAANALKMKNMVKIREHSKKGFYVEGLRQVLVVNHEDIQQRFEEGLVNRAVFLTSFNASTENSMTLVSVTLVQKIRNHRGDEVTRVATAEFYDLPACEILDDGVASNEYEINLSSKLKRNGIHCVSSCVDELLEASIAKCHEPVHFHTHVITKLMRNALSGNSKTWMMVTLSPSRSSYKTSLFALKLADKVRMLTTKSLLNEEVSSKLIREIKVENEKLRRLISLGEFDSNEYSSHHRLELGNHLSSTERDALKRKIIDDMKAQIRENEKEIRNLQQPFEERMKPFKMEKNDLIKKLENDKKNKCHVYNINSDSQISGKIVHIIPLGTLEFGHGTGNGKARENSQISFSGPGIREHHGTFTYNSKDGKISIKPAGPTCRILVNEMPILFETPLSHNDRILLGSNQLWVYQNPKETWLEKYPFSYKLHYELLAEELAVKSSCYQYLLSEHGILPETLQKQLVSLIPALDDAQCMTEDLNQNYTFTPLLYQPIDVLFRDGGNGESPKGSSDSGKGSSTYKADSNFEEETPSKGLSFLVKVLHTVDGTFTYWSYSKFWDRLELLKTAYMQHLEDGEVPHKEVDTFKEIAELDVPIGYSILCLKPLAYLINLEKPALPILDYITFQNIGSFHLSVHFCDDMGEKIRDEEVLLESVDQLVDENLTVVLSIRDVQGVTFQFKDIYCKYNFLEEGEQITKYLDAKGSNFIGVLNKYEKKFLIEPLTDNKLNIILTQFLVLQFFGKQRAHKMINLANYGRKDKGRLQQNPVEMESTLAELTIKAKTEQRQKQRLAALKSLLDQSEALGEEAIPVNVVRSLFEARTMKYAEQSLEDHRDYLTAIPEEPEPKQLPPELKALKRFSEVCQIC